jgi:hypothetical protein
MNDALRRGVIARRRDKCVLGRRELGMGLGLAKAVVVLWYRNEAALSGLLT